MNAIWFALPAALLGLALAALALRRPGRPRQSDWVLSPPELPQSQLRTVCVEPRLLVGERQLSLQLWLPLLPAPPERFRSSPGALLLSAAMALTADRLPPLRGWTSGDWLSLLHISEENFRKKHPAVGTMAVAGFQGTLVLDGLAQRAYFSGGPELAAACALVLDGTERPLGRRDAARLAALPPDCWCFATCAVQHGEPGPLVYLGAVRPVELLQHAPAALAAVEALRRIGVSTRQLPAEEPLRQGEAELREAAAALGYLEEMPGPGTLCVRAGSGADGDFSAPVLEMLRRARAQRAATARAQLLALALALAGLFSGADALSLLLSLGALALGLALYGTERLERPVRLPTLQDAVCLLPFVLAVPLALRLLAGLAGGAWAVGMAAGLTLGAAGWLCWRYVSGAGRALAPLAVLALGVVLALVRWPLAALAGLVVGVGCGLGIEWVLRRK